MKWLTIFLSRRLYKIEWLFHGIILGIYLFTTTMKDADVALLLLDLMDDEPANPKTVVQNKPTPTPWIGFGSVCFLLGVHARVFLKKMNA